MPELIAKPAFQGQSAVNWGGLSLEPLPPGPIFGVALFPGAPADLLPAPGSWDDLPLGEGSTRRVWTGREAALIFGDLPEGLSEWAAITDQTGAWAGMALSGARVADALARLVPLDLRLSAFAPGQVRRSLLGHIPLLLLRISPERFELRVPRSMARSAWEDIGTVLDRVEARANA